MQSIAACSFEIKSTGAAIQLLPTGAFRARDGRPKEVTSGHWLIDSAVARRLIETVGTRATDIVIDYEHQTLNSAENGHPAPAAAWFKSHALEWREGLGLFASSVDWTDKAKAMIAAREYRYLSPVFSYDKRTGEVLDLHHVGLTNYPALDGMSSLQALAAARFGQGIQGGSTAQVLSHEEQEVCRLLGLTNAEYQAMLKGNEEQTDPLLLQLSQEEQAACKATGLSPKDFIAARAYPS